MARTRQKAKQRRAKRLEQERKAAERTRRGDGRGGSSAQAVTELEEAQQRAAAELEKAQAAEVGAAAEAARSAAAAEAAAAAESAVSAPSTPVQKEEAPPKPGRRERRRLEAERKQKARPAPQERKREPRARGRVASFFVQVWAELRRVQWPGRNQVTQATAVVIVFCAIAGAYLAIWDFVFNKLIKAIL